jgi:hypothetical protein
MWVNRKTVSRSEARGSLIKLRGRHSNSASQSLAVSVSVRRTPRKPQPLSQLVFGKQPGCNLGTRGKPELVEDMAQVVLRRSFGDHQALCDLLVRQPLRYERTNLQLPPRESCVSRRTSHKALVRLAFPGTPRRSLPAAPRRLPVRAPRLARLLTSQREVRAATVGDRRRGVAYWRLGLRRDRERVAAAPGLIAEVLSSVDRAAAAELDRFRRRPGLIVGVGSAHAARLVQAVRSRRP